jgi:hypothetical protein
MLAVLGAIAMLLFTPQGAAAAAEGCVAARIMAAKVVLPFMLPKPQEPRTVPYDNDEIVRRLQEGRARVAERNLIPRVCEGVN